jgi:hypothetical protein
LAIIIALISGKFKIMGCSRQIHRNPSPIAQAGAIKALTDSIALICGESKIMGCSAQIP